MTDWPRGGYPAGDTPASELKPPPANMISKQRLEAATYTAAEVKVLTEAARKEAGEEIAAEFEYLGVILGSYVAERVRALTKGNTP